jgi:hypothetical protein
LIFTQKNKKGTLAKVRNNQELFLQTHHWVRYTSFKPEINKDSENMIFSQIIETYVVEIQKKQNVRKNHAKPLEQFAVHVHFSTYN